MLKQKHVTAIGYLKQPEKMTENEGAENSLLKITEPRKRISVEAWTGKGTAAFGSFLIGDVYPEIAKYVRLGLYQKMDETCLIVGHYFKKYNTNTPVIFYIPYNITFRYFLEDVGFDTNLFYYVENYIITKEDMDLPLEVLSKIGPLRPYTYFTFSKRKYIFTNYDWKTIDETKFYSFYGEFK